MNAVKNDDLGKQLKDSYDAILKKEEDLKKQLGELQSEKKALKAYLVAKGVLEKKARKKQQPATE